MTGVQYGGTVHSKQTSISTCVVSLTVVAPLPSSGVGGKYTAVATSLPPDLWFTDQRSNLAGRSGRGSRREALVMVRELEWKLGC